MPRKPEKKIAIVTGSTNGIGKSIAQELAVHGNTVVITSSSIERSRNVADEINTRGAQALGLQFNIEKAVDLKSLIKDTIDAFGRLDILVNNALSQSCVLPLDTLSDEQIEFAFTSNITNTFLLTHLAYPYLRKSRGNIINIGSVIVNRHLLGLPVYSIIKGAILQMTKALAAEWAADGIRVNAINPGFIRTSAFSNLGMPEDLIEKSYDFYKNYHPLGRIGKPKEIGKIAAYLVSDNADLITGAVVDIDGGYSIQGSPLYKSN